jgi:hypothetical protein
MAERDAESFDLDDDFLGESSANEESSDYDRFLDRTDRRVRQNPAASKRGKAAWSKLEEVLADKKLEKDLRDYYDEDV